MARFRPAKQRVRAYQRALSALSFDPRPESVAEALGSVNHDQHQWRGSWPFRYLSGPLEIATDFWCPLMQSLTRLQRREDIFIAGSNIYDERTWVLSMGHFMGLFDTPFLSIPATGRIANLRYAEFSCVEGDRIVETGMFLDLIGLMQQAGVNPLPPSTGTYYTYPGPIDHRGLHDDDSPPEEGEHTLALINRMVEDLSVLNKSGSMTGSRESLANSWHEDMVWYGPAGIGATYTIDRYQHQHQLPFRSQLTDKQFEGHVCRIAEGNYGCFFGWPNLSNTPIGGFLGMPSSCNASMQVVDVYRRDGDKLAENWVLIDLPWWLDQQGLDVLARNRELQRNFRAPH